jgi:hypothetical protein
MTAALLDPLGHVAQWDACRPLALGARAFQHVVDRDVERHAVGHAQHLEVDILVGRA